MQLCGVEAAITQAVFELDALGLRADQAEVGKVIALEQGGGEFQVQRVIVGHHDAVTAHGQLGNFVDRFFADDFTHALGDMLREFLLARIDPAHPTRQARQQRHQCAADVAGAKYGDLCLHLAHRFEQQHGRAAAALAQARAEAEALQMGVLLAAGEHVAGELHRFVFQVPAADGVERLRGTDHHLRTGIARRGAELFDDGDQYAGFALVLQVGEGADPVVHVYLNISVVSSTVIGGKPPPTLECIHRSKMWEGQAPSHT